MTDAGDRSDGHAPPDAAGPDAAGPGAAGPGAAGPDAAGPDAAGTDAAGTDAVEVRREPARSRFIALVDGQLAGVAEYRDAGGARVFTHTIVEPAFEGRGVATRLIGDALADTVAAGHEVVARCSFVVRYLDQHPEVPRRP